MTEMFPQHRHVSAHGSYKTVNTCLFLGVLLSFLQVRKKHIWLLKLLFSPCLMLSLPIKTKWDPKASLVITSHSLGSTCCVRVTSIVVMWPRMQGTWERHHGPHDHRPERLRGLRRQDLGVRPRCTQTSRLGEHL